MLVEGEDVVVVDAVPSEAGGGGRHTDLSVGLLGPLSFRFWLNFEKFSFLEPLTESTELLEKPAVWLRDSKGKY